MRYKRANGVLSAVLAASMTLGLTPVAGISPAFAEGEGQQAIEAEADKVVEVTSSDSVIIEGTGNTASGNEKLKVGDIEFTPWTEKASLPTSGNYYLANDVALSEPWVIAAGATVNLHLNGKTVRAMFEAADSEGAVTVSEGATLGLYDTEEDLGIVTHGEKSIGIGVDVKGGAKFNLHGGSITGFKTGVYVNKTEKVATQATNATETSTTDNTSTTDSSSTTVDNTKQVADASTEQAAGTSTEQAAAASTEQAASASTEALVPQADEAQPEVVRGTFEMTGGFVDYNAEHGVYTNGDFTMSGGNIENNGSDGTKGAGVYATGAKVAVKGGTITGNTALEAGGGVYLDNGSTLEVSGKPVITNNKAKSATSNVYLLGKDQLITVANKLETGASIGVTHVDDAHKIITDAFTTGYKDKGNTEKPSAYFTSDDPAYVAAFTEDGKEARFVAGYKIVVAPGITNGVVAINAALDETNTYRSAAGETIIITPTPGVGYRVESVSATDASGKALTVTNNQFVMPESDVTVNATFVADQAVITFNANGGAGTMANQTVKTGEVTALNANTFTRSGFTFLGWNTKADGTGTFYADKASAMFKENITLYAQWRQTTTPATSTTTKAATKTLAATGDATSMVPVAVAAAAGIGLAAYGIRKRRS